MGYLTRMGRITKDSAASFKAWETRQRGRNEEAFDMLGRKTVFLPGEAGQLTKQAIRLQHIIDDLSKNNSRSMKAVVNRLTKVKDLLNAAIEEKKP